MELFEFLYDKITQGLIVSVAVPLLAALAVAYRWDAGLTRATLTIGRRIAPNLGGTGMQDAVTPQWQWKVTVFVWALTIVILATAFLRFGAVVGSLLVVWFIVAAMLVGIFFIPAPESPHYLNIISASLVGRHADFARDGDAKRAQAALHVIERIVSAYGPRAMSIDPKTLE